MVAGEPSGDFLGAGLIEALAKRFPDARFEGIGGPHMQAAGLSSIYPLSSLSVMGLIEVIKHLPRLLAIRRSLRRRWLDDPPDVFVGIDAPDFNLGLAEYLRGGGIPTVHYVCPTVWAWRRGRTKKIYRAVDRVLCIYPFEPDLLKSDGIDACFVGHPIADEIPINVERSAARSELGIDANAESVALLPGSRVTEVSRLMPIYLDVARRILAHHPQVNFIIPAATQALKQDIQKRLASTALASRTRVIDGQARSAMASADAAVIASGTATLEAMMLGCPAVIVYRVNALTALIAKLTLKIQWVGMPNLLANKELMPEFIQGAARAELIAPEIIDMLNQPQRRLQLRAQFEQLHLGLRCNANESAAKAVANLLNEPKNRHCEY